MVREGIDLISHSYVSCMYFADYRHLGALENAPESSRSRLPAPDVASIALKILGRGRLLFLLAAGITVLVDFAVTMISAPYLAPAMVEGAVVRVLITVALFYAIWRGLPWARWLVVSLLAL
jgi:hypothetical protein